MSMRLILALILLVAPLTALAERPGQYWGVTLDSAVLTDTSDEEENATNLNLMLGYKFNDFLGVEFQGGGGSEDDVLYAGAFARFDLPFERVNVFLLAGGAATEFDDASTGDRETESDLAAGLGIELFGNERTALRLQYMNYADTTYETIGLGFVHHFDWPRFR